jgi:general nucleoside transport system ATP-binding protein
MSAPPLLEATLAKRFGIREVLQHATIRVTPGTVHALVGENGAGKSTLVKIISGVLRGDGGTLTLHGTRHPIASWTRQRARAAGIGIVQQHGAFAGTLTVVENAVLGVEPFAGPLLDLEPTAQKLRELGTKVGMPIDPHARADALSLGAAQRAEVVAALHHGANLLILDEPTAVLTPIEVEGFLGTLRSLAESGTTIIIVTHKLDEVRAVADDVTVLRAGKTVATFAASEKAEGPHRLDVHAIARAMVGADLPEPSNVPAPADDAKVALSLAGVGVPGALQGLALQIREGELVGVAGVDGNGQRELAHAIAGLVPHTGTVVIGGRSFATHAAAASRLAAGLAHIPEDRHHGGLVLDATVADNLVLGRHDITGRFLVDHSRVRQFVDTQIAALDIRPTDPDAVVSSLSGGNQQKIVIARELSRPSLRCVLAAQPTRGVDLGAVARIHDQLRAAARSNAGVLVISADLDELLALCHRIVVMLRGRIVGERAGADLRASDARTSLGKLMTGASGAGEDAA